MTRKVEPEVLAGFLEEARGYLPGIRAGIAACGPDHVEPLQEPARLAHTIKGAAANVGGLELRTAAMKLEKESRTGDLTAAGVAVSEIQASFDRVRPIMESLYREDPG